MTVYPTRRRRSALLFAAVVVSSKLSFAPAMADETTHHIVEKDHATTNIEQLVEQLQTSDSAVFRSAIRSPLLAGPAAAQLVPALRQSLTRDDAVLVQTAARAIGELGHVAQAAGPELVSLLDSTNANTKTAAIVALGQIGLGSSNDIEAKLVTAANDASPAVRQAALSVLADASIPRRYDAFLTALAGQDDVSKSLAIQGLRTQCPLCVAALTDALTDDAVCCDAAGLLSDIGPFAAPAIPNLIQHLKMESRESGKVESLIALASIGPASLLAEKELLNALDSESAAVTAAAAYAVGAIGVPSSIERLKEIASGDAPPTVRLSAAKSLAQLSQSPRDQKLAVDLTVAMLHSESDVVQEVAVQTAVELSSVTHRIVQALYAKAEVIETDALIEIGPAAILGIDHRLKVDRTRAAALAVVTALGPAARVATPTLLELLDNPETSDRTTVIRALAAVGVNRQGQADTVVIQRLLKHVSSSTDDQRVTAALAVAVLSPEIAKSISDVRTAVQDGLSANAVEQKLDSIRVLSRIAPGKTTATLLEGLLGEEAAIHDAAASALVDMRN